MGLKHVLAAGLLLASCARCGHKSGTTCRSRSSRPGDWPTYSGQLQCPAPFTALKQITPANVGRLQAKWVYHMTGQKDLEATPIVANGVMYISQYQPDGCHRCAHRQYDLAISAPAHRHRRPARHRLLRTTSSIVTTTDNHLLALDARNGACCGTWRCDGGTAAGRPGAADRPWQGDRLAATSRDGYIQAYDAETGKYLWTWSPIPGAGRSGAGKLGRRTSRTACRSG